MIKVSILRKKDIINEITMTGHAKYDDYGKDIVCAAASSIAITSVNAILRINEKAITVSSDGDLKIIVNTHDSVTDKLLDNMIDLLMELQEQYKKNININNREVSS
ncbi:MAG TPA: ribosomal-processing cysteine protease Prp [Bacilli bacterium]|nr:ribosomal-processing cysteine protease Prp [Bacilli bacterium]